MRGLLMDTLIRKRPNLQVSLSVMLSLKASVWYNLVRVVVKFKREIQTCCTDTCHFRTWYCCVKCEIYLERNASLCAGLTFSQAGFSFDTSNPTAQRHLAVSSSSGLPAPLLPPVSSAKGVRRPLPSRKYVVSGPDSMLKGESNSSGSSGATVVTNRRDAFAQS